MRTRLWMRARRRLKIRSCARRGSSCAKMWNSGNGSTARLAADERIAHAISAVEVPAHLRERLLNLAEAAPPSNVLKFPARRMLLFALAASVVIGLIGVVLKTYLRTPEMPGWESDSLAMVQGLDSGKSDLDHKNSQPR